MRCYAWRATWMSVFVLVVWVLFGRALTHYLDIAALMTSIAVVFGGALVAATTAFFSFRAIQRRRAMAGGCVGCEHKCQHAMTGGSGSARLWLISTADRGVPAPAHRGAPAAAARELVMLPTPRWPDRPLRAGTPCADTPREEIQNPVGRCYDAPDDEASRLVSRSLASTSDGPYQVRSRPLTRATR